MTAETQQANEPYEAKNVLITGGAGFIASHVAILFAKKYPQYKVRPRAPVEARRPRARAGTRGVARASRRVDIHPGSIVSHKVTRTRA